MRFNPILFYEYGKRRVNPIINNGLIVHYDFGNINSYPGTGTAVTDLVGTNNGTLINGPTFDSSNQGNMVFHGPNEYMYSPITPLSLMGNSSFTVSGFFKSSGSWSQGSTWGFGGNSTNLNINSWNLNTIDEISLDLWGNTTFGSGQFYSTTQWKYIVWTKTAGVFSRNNIQIFVDNVKYTGNSLFIRRGNETSMPNITGEGIVLARAGNESNYYGKPIISNFCVYNRVLTESEILYNYNILKTRFGL